MSKEGVLEHKEQSPTAATVGNPIFGPSGVQTYRCLMATAVGTSAAVDVDAATGDEAAALALGKVPGGKVMNVFPAPQSAQTKKAA